VRCDTNLIWLYGDEEEEEECSASKILFFFPFRLSTAQPKKTRSGKERRKMLKKLVTKKIASDPLFGRLSFDFFSRIEREIMWSLAEKKAFLR
jgi:hypothetical protein